MESLWSSLKSLSAWQLIVLVVVLFGSGTTVYLVYAERTQAEPTELAENQQVIPVSYGDIVNQVSTNGNLAFPERETLRFGIQGTVGALLVEEGQTISLGEELARLDAGTIATLDEDVAQARVDLLDAEEALEELLEPSTEATRNLEQAEAEANIADARYQIQLAREALEETLDPEIPTLMDVEAQKERIAATELEIQQVQEAREDLLNPDLPSNQEVRAQEEVIADARVKLQEAIDARDELLNRDLQPDYQAQLADSQQQQADAEKELEEIQDALADLAPTQRELAQARQNLLAAQVALDEANSALEDFLQAQGSEVANRREEKADLETELQAARSTLARMREAYNNGNLGLLSSIARWEIYVDSLEDELGEVRFGIVSQAEQLETGISLAEAALVEAEEALADLEQGANVVEQVALEARAQAVLATMEVIQRDLAELERPEVDPQELELKEAQIVLAEANVAQAIEDLAELQEELAEPPDPLELQLNAQQLELARATLSQQQADYEELLEDRLTVPDPHEVALREQQVALSQATLARAEEALAELLDDHASPPDPLEVALAEQAIVASQVRLTTAEEDRAAAVITSPIAGYVSAINVEQGDNVEARAAIMEVVDPSIVEVDGIVDEIDVLLVQVGTTAEVVLDALPGVTLEGVVTEIAEEAQNQQGVVSYPISIQDGCTAAGKPAGRAERRGQHRPARGTQRPFGAAAGPVRQL